MKKSLRQREDDMQTVSGMAGIILLACDVDQKITFINKKGCEIMGHKEEEIIGRKLFETLFFDRVGKREKATFKKAMKKGAESIEWNFEGHISTTKGEERIIVWHNTVLTDERGEKIGILCLGKDMTEEKRMEEKLLAINRLNYRISQTFNIGEIANIILDEAEKVLTFSNTDIFILDDKKQEISTVARRGSLEKGDVLRLPLDGKGITAACAREGRIIYVPDVREDERYIKESESTLSELSVPLKVQERTIGVFDIERVSPNGFTKEDIILAETLASSAAIAIQNAQLFTRAQLEIGERKQAEQIQSMLYKIANATNTTKDLNDLYKSIRSILGTVMDTTNFAIALYDKKTDTISSPYLEDEKDKFGKFPAGKTLTAYVIRKSEPLLATEEIKKKLIQEGEYESLGTSSKIWLGVPLKIGKEVIGAITVQSYTEASLYTKKDLRILEFVSDQIAVAIERKWMEEKLAAIYNLSRDISLSLDLDKIFERVLNACEKVLDFRFVALLLIDEKKNELSTVAVKGFRENVVNIRFSLKEDYGITTWVAKNGKTIYVTDVSKDSRYAKADLKVKSELAVPLKIGEKTIGVLNAESERLDAFSESDRRLLEILANQTAIAIQNARLFEETQSEIAERKQAEQIQSVLHKIANAANMAEDISDLFASIQNHLSTIVDTTNFYIALYSKETDAISIPYHFDERDSVTSFPAGKSLTSYVIKNDKPLLVTWGDIEKLIGAGEIEPVGTPSKVWLGVPLKIGKEVMGAIVVQSYTDVSLYTEKDLKILEFVSGQIAIAIERKRAEEALKESKNKIERLHIVAAQMEAAQSEEEIYRLAMGAAEGILDFSQASIQYVEDDYLKIAVTTEKNVPEDYKMSIHEGLGGKTVRTGKSYLVSDVAKDNDAKPTDGEFRSILSIPIGSFGVFQAFSYKVGSFTEGDLKLTELLVSHLVEALKRIKSEEALKASKNKIKQLHKVAARMEAAQTEDEVCHLAIDAAGRILDFITASIQHVEDDYLKIKIATEENIPEDYRMSINEGVGGKTYRTGKSYLIDDITKDKDAKPTDDTYRSVISVPIGDYGVFQTHSNRIGHFTNEDLELAELLMSHVNEALKRIESEEALRKSKDKIEQLHRISARIEAVQTEEEVYCLTIEAAERILRFAICDVSIVEGDWFVVKCASSNQPAGTSRNMSLNEGIIGETYRTGKSCLIKDMREVERAKPVQSELRSLLSIPIGTVGVFQAASAQVGAFEKEDLELAELLMSHVTEALKRIQSGKVIRDSEERYRTLFDNIADPVMVFDQETHLIMDCNSSFIKRYGYALDELRQMTPYHLHPPEDLKTVQENIDDKENFAPHTYTHMTKGGEKFPVEVFTQELEYKGRKSWISIMRDITERRKAEEALRRSEERYRGILEKMEECYYELDLAGNLTFFNPITLKMFGYNSSEELLGLNYKQYTDKENAEKLFLVYHQVFLTGEPAQFEFELKNKDGRTMVMESSISLKRDEEGKPVGFRGVTRNITERKRAEKALRESEERFRNLFENAVLGVYRTTPDGQILMANPALIKMMGYSSFDELASRDLEKEGFESEHPREEFKTMMEKEGEVKGLESAWVKHDGSLIFVRENAKAIRGEEGKILYYEGTVEDITESRRAENRQAIVYRIADATNKSTNLWELSKFIHHEIDVIIDARNFYISLYDASQKLITFPYYIDENYADHTRPPRKFGKGLTEYVITSGKALLATQEKMEQMSREGKIESVGTPSSVWLGVPLTTKGKTFGVMAVQSYKDSNVYTQNDLKFMEYVSDQIAIVIERKVAEEKLSAIYDLSREITLAMDVDKIFEKAMDACQRVLDFKIIGIFLLDEGKRELYLKTHRDYPEEAQHLRFSLEGEKGITTWVAKHGESLLVPDVSLDPRFVIGESSVRSELAVPIKVGEKVIGVLNVESEKLDGFSDEDRKLLETLASQTAVAIENAKLYTRIKEASDYLTNIVESASDGIIAADMEGKILTFNRSAEVIFGYEASEVVGTNVRHYYPEGVAHDIMRRIRESEDKRIVDYEILAVGKGGERIPLSLSASLLCDHKREPIGSIGVFRDLREKKKNEEKLAAIYDLSREMSLSLNLDSVFEKVLDACEEVLDFEMIGLYLIDEMSRELCVRSSRGYPEEVTAFRLPLDGGGGITVWVANHKQSLIVSDVSQDPRYVSGSEKFHNKSELAVPLMVSEKVIGVLNIESEKLNAFSEDDQKLLETLANQAAIAIQNARLFEETQSEIAERKQAENRQAIAYRIADAANRATNLEELFGCIRDELGHVIDTTNFYIALYNASNNEVTFPYYIDEKDSPEAIQTLHREYGEGLTEFIIETGKAAIFYEDDLKQRKSIGFLARTWLGVPLITRGNTIGVMAVQSYSNPHAYTQEDLEFMEFVSSQIAVVIERKRSEEKLAAIYDFSREMSLSLNLDSVFEKVFDACEEVLDFEMINLYLIDEMSHELCVRALRGFPEEVTHRLPLDGEKGITVWVANNKRSLIVPDVSQDPRYVGGSETFYSKSELAVPLMVGEKVIGVLNIESERLDAFSEDDMKLLETLANQAAVAIQNAQLYEEIQGRVERLAIVNRIAKAAGATLRLEDLMEIVYQEIAAIFQADAFFIALYDEKTNEMYFPYTIDEGIRESPQSVPLGIGLTSKVFSEKKPLIIQDFEKEKEHFPQTHLFGTMKLPISWLGVPMLIGDRAIGVIGVQSYHPYSWDNEDTMLLFTIVDQIAVAIENARLFEQAQHEITQRKKAEEKLTAIYDLSKEITLTINLEKIFEKVLDACEKVLDFEMITLYLIDEEKQNLCIKVSRGYPGELKDFRLSLSGEKGITVWVAKHGESLIVPDVSKDPRYVRGDPKEKSQSELAVPLKAGEKVIGVLNAESEMLDTFSEDDRRLLEALAGQAAVAIENARLFEQAQHEITQRKKAEEKLTAIHKMAEKLALSLEVDAIVNTTLEIAQDILEFKNCAIALMDKEKQELYIKAQTGFPENLEVLKIPLKGKGITAWVANNGQSLLVPDVSTDERYIEWTTNIRSELCVPLKVKDEVIGVLNVESEKLNFFSTEDQMLLETLASEAAVALENARLFEREREAALQIEFLNDLMSHDINNLNQISLGYLELLRNLGLTEKQRMFAEKALNSVKSSAQLVENVKKLQKLKGGEIKLEKLNLKDLLLEVIPEVSHRADKNVDVTFSPHDIWISGTLLLKDVFFNLMDNAIKYTLSHDVKIEVCVQELDDSVRVCIKDWGSGIPDEMKTKIFDRFERIGKGVKGSGLGLYIVKMIVTKLSGKIWVEDNPEGGSVFCVEFPGVAK